MDFQSYLQDQVLKALTFFVDATFYELLNYIMQSLTYGLYRYSIVYNAESITKNGNDRLNILIKETLKYLQKIDAINYCPTEKRYFIPDIRASDERRRNYSHLIFDAILHAMEEGKYEATLGEIMSYVKHIYTHDITRNKENSERSHVIATGTTLLILRSLECVTLKMERMFRISFD